MNDLTHFSLFSGIGGIDLASEWAGFRTVGQCEMADYPTKILEKHWPDVPRWRDVRDVTSGSVREKGIEHITLLSGGFPCQPFSCAGKRRGKDDDRFLWPEMLRIVSELRPAWVLGENVAGIVSMELPDCIADLESLEYQVRAFLIPACGVEARHQRYRVFIVANSTSGGCSPRSNRVPSGTVEDKGEYNTEVFKNWNRSRIGDGKTGGDVADMPIKRKWELPISKWKPQETNTNLIRCCKDVSYSNCTTSSRFQQHSRKVLYSQQEGSGKHLCGIWRTEPNVGRVAHGAPKRVDRLKCLGNSVVPQQVYPILKAIADIEKMGIN